MKGRRRGVKASALVLAMLLPVALLGQTTTRCPEGRAAAGDLGIVGLKCVGPSAACVIYEEGPTGLLQHSFAVEPIISELTPTATRSGHLQVGDVLVALDGRLITTGEGGRYMAQLEAGRYVNVVVRRKGAIIEGTIRTGEGCGVRSLSVGIR